MSPSSLIHDIRTMGLRGAMRYYRKRIDESFWVLIDRSFDRRYNVDTAGHIDLPDLSISSPNVAMGAYYEPIPEKILRQFVAELPIRHEDFTLIDCGSGKGRALLVAAEYPFRRIVGVEFARELHEITCRNFQTYRNPRQKCFALESLCEDAVHYAWPEEPAVIFMFGTFMPPLLRSVLDGLVASLEAKPRETYLVYYSANPVGVQMVRDLGWECRQLQTRFTLADRDPQKRVALVLHHTGKPIAQACAEECSHA